ncbi:MAG: MerR family transcriptional regulator [Candidatus Omnitrophica bacterium]|nr:MerR family transcriptional regulator [Candidatus Omnitrophota bacterium]
MEKAKSRVYLLKDLSSLTGFSIYTLKFYLQLGLIHEADRSPATRFRYFDDATVARLQQIRRLRLQKRTLAEIRALLARKDEAGVVG